MKAINKQHGKIKNHETNIESTAYRLTIGCGFAGM
jgi:hypothetical protein